jgi:hypothetical protein
MNAEIVTTGFIAAKLLLARLLFRVEMLLQDLI